MINKRFTGRVGENRSYVLKKKSLGKAAAAAAATRAIPWVTHRHAALHTVTLARQVQVCHSCLYI